MPSLPFKLKMFNMANLLNYILVSILILANIDPQDFPPRDQTKEHFDGVEII